MWGRWVYFEGGEDNRGRWVWEGTWGRVRMYHVGKVGVLRRRRREEGKVGVGEYVGVSGDIA
jgi:hypothetical protein